MTKTKDEINVPVEVELDDATDKIIIKAEYRYKDLVKTIPGTQYDRTNLVWHMPVSWAGCLALKTEFSDVLVIGPKLKAWYDNEWYTRVAPSNSLRLALDFPEGYTDLFPHQKAGVEFMATGRRVLLADEPGLGKTAQAIRALAALTARGENIFPVLVVCPNTLKSNWAREFAKWWPGANVEVIRGSAVQRRKQFKLLTDPEPDTPKPHVVVMNWESLRSHSRLAPYGGTSLIRCEEHGGTDSRVTEARCEVHPKELNQIEFKAVIADEIHRSKDPKSKQTRALWAATGDADVRFALTGTPIADTVIDLWPILHWLKPEEFPSKTRWIERMVNVMYNAFGSMMVQGIKPDMSDEFYASVNPRMRRMLKKVVLPWLPEILYERRDTEMSAKQKKAYAQMRDHMIAELDNDHMTVVSAMTQVQRLLQFASSYAEVEEVPVVNKETGETEYEVVTTLIEPSSKVDALMDDIKAGDFGEDSVAVTAVSKQLINLLSARLTKEKIEHGLITGDVSEIDRQRAVESFQAGHIKWILFTAQAGGVGITLTRARRLVRLQRPYSLIDDKQVNDRVHRIGSEIHDNIVIMDYMTDNTVEDRVVEILRSKEGNFEEVVRDKDQLLAALLEDKTKK